MIGNPSDRVEPITDNLRVAVQIALIKHHLYVVGDAPIVAIFESNRSWSMLSRAFGKSSRISAVIILLPSEYGP